MRRRRKETGLISGVGDSAVGVWDSGDLVAAAGDSGFSTGGLRGLAGFAFEEGSFAARGVEDVSAEVPRGRLGVME
jgi:hypothetical protein